jgi:sulfur carrier protein
VKIILNGKQHALHEACSVTSLLASLGIAPRRLAIELNDEILPRSQFDSTQLAEGDSVEIVQAIGGG